MHVDLAILGALLPVFGVILAGHLFRRLGMPGDSFWPPAERLTYYVLFPVLLFQKTATIDLASFPLATLTGTVFAGVAVMTALLLVVKRIWSIAGPGFTSVFQGSIRFNTYVGLAVAAALFGDRGLAMAAVTVSLLIPLVNLISVTVLLRYGSANRKSGAGFFLIEVLRTPPLLACVAGLGFNAFGLALPSMATASLTIFGQAALPLGLLAVGASLDLAVAQQRRATVLLTCCLKLLVFPVVMWSGSALFALTSQVAAIAVLFAALPGSPVSYILAGQLGGDSKLLSAIVSAQTILALITLPIILGLLPR